MKEITVHGGSGVSRILVGERLQNLHHYVPIENAVVVTDKHIWQLHRDKFPACPVIHLARGERHKTLETVATIYDQLLDLQADRSTFIVAVGGGIVCDVAGFAAATFMRGVPCGYVATTLLAQVDASVGGKTGVNYHRFKNMVGVFQQPRFVICDLALLETLPPEEFWSGMAEVVKHALIKDAALLADIEQHCRHGATVPQPVVERLVYQSVMIKQSVVDQDEKEAGLRRQLNFGHTFGHAVEALTGISHGEAVSIGMVAACAVSVHKGLLSQLEMDRVKRLLLQLGLPTRLMVDPDRLLETVLKDKKRERDAIHFVLLNRIGECQIEKMDLAALRSILTVLVKESSA